METVVYTAPPGRSRLIMLLGLVFAVAGALGTLLLTFMLGILIPEFFQGRAAFLSFQLLFQLMWLVFFISLFITGLSLMRSGVKRKRKDLVPGLTLYFLGAALVVNGMMLMTFGDMTRGVILTVTGIAAMLVEWSTEVV